MLSSDFRKAAAVVVLFKNAQNAAAEIQTQRLTSPMAFAFTYKIELRLIDVFAKNIFLICAKNRTYPYRCCCYNCSWQFWLIFFLSIASTLIIIAPH